MIAIIRIRGIVNTNKKVEEALSRIRLRRKYCCVILKETPEVIGVLKKVRNTVAYGKINEDTLLELIKIRGKVKDKAKSKVENPEIISKEFLAGKKFEELGIKPFFRLHPPRGGIKSKMHYPIGVLGNNKEDINKLIKRML